MQVTVNGQPMQLEAGTTVAMLLELLALDARHLAVERNLELVPRAAHGATALEPGDRIEVVTLVGGG
ncbi:MAG TPA: sulfur carrier protein ThiS [Lacipirellulaceae bacterium]|nr:sulfur carrier protein ThiS [Lacipirellulaceae bacterium]